MDLIYDKDGVTKAMLFASILATCKNSEIFPKHIKWQLNAYTNWNLSMIFARYFLSIKEWDQFLCVNSIGIFLGFRTAFTQGLDDNIRKKLCSMGFRLSKLQFFIGDMVVHTLPAIGMASLMVHQKRKIKYVHVTYAMTLMTWFTFRQVGKLDVSDIYVPHPWKRAWFAAFTGMILSPELISSIQQKNIKKINIILILFLFPYLLTRLDPKLKNKYDFEYILEKNTKKYISNIKRSVSEFYLYEKVDK